MHVIVNSRAPDSVHFYHLQWESMMPVEEMNHEEAMAAVPHLVPEHRPGKPEFWPFDKTMDEWNEELKQIKVEYDEHHSMKP